MSRGEKIISYITVILLILSVIPQYFEWAGVKPSVFTPYFNVILPILSILAIFVILTAVYSRRKAIKLFLAMPFLNKLKHKIVEELETEVVIKNITFSRQPKRDVLLILANRVSYDIMDTKTPKNYRVQPSDERDGDVWIDGDVLTLPLLSAEILVVKMTELSKNPKYRGKSKWLYLFWVR